MITLTQSDVTELIACFKSSPVRGIDIVSMTGLDIRQLLEARIICLARWGDQDQFMRGENFPLNKNTK